MSTSLLYHGLGIQGYQQVHTRFHAGAIHFRVRPDDFSLRCPECGSYKVQRRGQVMRRFRTLPMGSKPTVNTPLAKIPVAIAHGLKIILA